MESVISFVSISKKPIEILLNPLPPLKETIEIFTTEKAPLFCWIKLAKSFYNEGYSANFCEILEKSRDNADLNYPGSDEDQMIQLDSLAAYYVNLARKETTKEAKRENMIRATRLYTAADKIIMLQEDHLIGRAFLCLMESDKIDQADAQFNFVLDQNSNNVLALIGKARINFLRDEIRIALSYYRKALELFPEGIPSIRLGIGMCLYKMGRIDLAKLAFERTVEMDPNCVEALTALAIIHLNEKSAISIKLGMQMLANSYELNRNSPLVLNILADHFFYKLDYSKAERLASLAMQNTNNDSVRALSFYLLGRCYHVKENFENSYNYYFQATQLASSKFVLPWYGLAQIYLKRADIDNAIKCLEKVLSASPCAVEAMKLLCLCYIKSEKLENMPKARAIYKKVVELFPNDEESWIGLAEVNESTNIKESLDAYLKAISIMESKNVVVPTGIKNNLGSLYYRLENYVTAKEYFESALAQLDQESVLADSRLNPLFATIRYNLGKVHEKTGQMQMAETIYQDIIKDFPDYMDPYLRLGCIYRSRGDFREASGWFNTALKVDPDNSEAWLHIANLHLLKHEYGPAQKKFEKVMMADKENPDFYSWLSLGNIWLSLLHVSLNNPEKKKKFSERCLGIYRSVLKRDPKNICAANGIGCVLAYNSFTSVARDVFSQCREATADIVDIWLNLGHIYMENKQYINATKMYESCYEKFYTQIPNTELLIYLARAYFKADQMSKAKDILIKLLHYSPRDVIALFNFSLILERMAESVLKNDKATYDEVRNAILDIEFAHRNFSHIINDCEQARLDPKVCEGEQKACSDLLTQANYHLQRAKQQQDEEAELIRKHKEQVMAIAQSKVEEEERELAEKKLKEEELVQRRAEYLKNAQSTLLSMPMLTKERSKKVRNKLTKKQIKADKKVEDTKKPKKSRKRKMRVISDDITDNEMNDPQAKNFEIPQAVDHDEKYKNELEEIFSSEFSEEDNNNTNEK